MPPIPRAGVPGARSTMKVRQNGVRVDRDPAAAHRTTVQPPDDQQEVDTVKLTIESADSIEQVLAVVGVLYQVELAVSAPSAASPAPTVDDAPPENTPAPAARSSRRRAAATKGPAKRAVRTPGPTAGPTADSAGIRAWARENGVSVSPRGRIPATVQQQYEAAQA